jgi:hypothetical protein
MKELKAHSVQNKIDEHRQNAINDLNRRFFKNRQDDE